MKYKICKCQNDLDEWYQIKIKWLIFWYNYESKSFPSWKYFPWLLPMDFAGDRFSTKESAQEKINELRKKENKIRVLECVEA